MARLRESYKNDVFPALMEQFKYTNVMEVPKLEKVTINMGLGEAKENAKIMESAIEEISLITGQRPVVTRARKSIANFKVRQGMPVGAKVTLRGENMYDFIDKLFNIALPRVRDFKGVSKNSFDGRGNYSMGIKEQLIFPEMCIRDRRRPGISEQPGAHLSESRMGYDGGCPGEYREFPQQRTVSVSYTHLSASFQLSRESTDGII